MDNVGSARLKGSIVRPADMDRAIAMPDSGGNVEYASIPDLPEAKGKVFLIRLVKLEEVE